MPETKKAFWSKKLRRNKERDKEVNQLLTKEKWTVMRFWEHEINTDLDMCVNNILDIFNRTKAV